MRKGRHKSALVISLFAIFILIAGYFSFFYTPKNNGPRVIKVGIVGANKADIAIWKNVAQTVKQKYHVVAKTVSFDGYDQPDKALKSGDVESKRFSTLCLLK